MLYEGENTIKETEIQPYCEIMWFWSLFLTNQKIPWLNKKKEEMKFEKERRERRKAQRFTDQYGSEEGKKRRGKKEGGVGISQ